MARGRTAERPAPTGAGATHDEVVLRRRRWRTGRVVVPAEPGAGVPRLASARNGHGVEAAVEGVRRCGDEVELSGQTGRLVPGEVGHCRQITGSRQRA